MIKRMFASALFAGFAAGLIAAALQFVFVQPILRQAELYESGELVHVAAASPTHDQVVHASTGPVSAAGQATLATTQTPVDWSRTGLTVLFTALVYTGYALVLVSAFALSELRGEAISGRAGIIWGLAGFIVVHFAPAAGLPPELPGMSAGDLTGRHYWWAGTVATTAVGLWLLGFGKSAQSWALGALLVLAPHMIGAPHPDQMSGPVPPELAALFVGRSLGVGMAVWVILGSLAATIWSRQRV